MTGPNPYGQPGQNPNDQGQPQYGQQPTYGQPPQSQPHYGGQAPQGQAQYGPPATGLNPTDFSSRGVQLLWGIVGAAVLVLIAAFLPWASVAGESIMGTGDGKDGILTLICALIAGGVALAALFVAGKQPKLPMIAGIVAAVLGVIVVLIAIVDISDIGDTADKVAGFVEVSVGFGLWLTLVFGIVLLAAGAATALLSRKR